MAFKDSVNLTIIFRSINIILYLLQFYFLKLSLAFMFLFPLNPV